MQALYFEDFCVGQVFRTPAYPVTHEESVAFAQRYDPQFIHTDEEAAKAGVMGQLFTSGWLTACIGMKLKAATPLGRVAGGLLGMGVEGMKWLKPVFPGDALRVEIPIVEMRRSASRPTHGVITYRMDTFNQRDEKVMEATVTVWVPCKA